MHSRLYAFVYPHRLVSAPMAAVAARAVVTDFNGGDEYRRLFLLYNARNASNSDW
jgi:hypothetical protein